MSEQVLAKLQRVIHKLLNYEILPETETLIIGTFNPSTSSDDFFYGSSKNYLWTLLPKAFGAADLKQRSKEDKRDFIKARRIDFIDLISEVEVEEAWRRDDKYITHREPKWRNIILELNRLDSLKRVCFTRARTGLKAVPKIKLKIEEIEEYCQERNIRFDCLVSPARYYSAKKQEEWTAFFNDQQPRAKVG